MEDREKADRLNDIFASVFSLKNSSPTRVGRRHGRILGWLVDIDRKVVERHLVALD